MFEEPRNLLENKGFEQEDINKEENAIEDEGDPKPNEEITFKVRLNIGRDLDVKMKQQDSIYDLKNHVSRQLNDLDVTKIRILAKGRMLSNDYKIGDPFPIKNGDIIHASFPASLYRESLSKQKEGQ